MGAHEHDRAARRQVRTADGGGTVGADVMQTRLELAGAAEQIAALGSEAEAGAATSAVVECHDTTAGGDLTGVVDIEAEDGCATAGWQVGGAGDRIGVTIAIDGGEVIGFDQQLTRRNDREVAVDSRDRIVVGLTTGARHQHTAVGTS